jgi:hypothetical protein
MRKNHICISNWFKPIESIQGGSANRRFRYFFSAMYDPTKDSDNNENQDKKYPEKMPESLPDGVCVLRIEMPIYIPANILGREKAARATRIIRDCLQKLVRQNLVLAGGKPIAHLISSNPLESKTIEPE